MGSVAREGSFGSGKGMRVEMGVCEVLMAVYDGGRRFSRKWTMRMWEHSLKMFEFVMAGVVGCDRGIGVGVMC